MRLANTIFGIAVILALGIDLPADAATYYVSNPADPADAANRALLPAGSIVLPSLQKAQDNPALAPGDTVLAMNGIYRPDGPWWHNAVLVVSKSGAPNKPITFGAYPGHHPAITTAGIPNVMSDVEIDASWITLSGFEIIGHAGDVTLAQASATVAAHHTAYAAKASTPFDTLLDSGCVSVNKQTHVAVRRNVVHECSASGIGYEMSDWIQIAGNIVYDTSWWTEFDTSAINIHRMLNSDAGTGYKVRIYNNVAYNNGNTQPYYLDAAQNPAAQPTDGNGIIIDINQHTNDGNPYLGRTLIAGNLVYNNGGVGAHAYQSAHVDFINNTAVNNNICPVAGSSCGAIDGAQIDANVSVDVRFYDNIMVAPPGKYAFADWHSMQVVEDYNLFGALPIWKGDYKPATHDIVGDAQFKNVTRSDFRLAATSPARTGGIADPPELTAKGSVIMGALSAP